MKVWNCFAVALAVGVVSAMFAVDAHAASAIYTNATNLLTGMDGFGLATAASVAAVGRVKIQDLREERDEIAKSLRNLVDKETQGGEWNKDKQSEYDDGIGRIEAIDARIKREQKLMEIEADEHVEAAIDDMRGDPDGAQTSKARALMAKWLRVGDNGLSAEDWQSIRATMSTTTDSEGGYTVPTEVATTILEALKEFGGVRAVADVITTDSGNPMNFPTSDGTTEEGEIIAENQPATDQDADFGVKSLDVYKFSSKVVTVPFELLQDSSADIEAFIRARLATRLGRITNRMFTTGTGTGQPTGIVTASGAGKVGAVSASAAITYDDLLDLEHSIDPAYREMSAGWMMHDSMLKLIRKLKDQDGRPLYLPSYDAGIRGGVPAELMGHPITTNQQMAEPAPDAKSLLFGDFSYYKVRDVMAMSLFRFSDSVYTKRGQVGFLAWMRSGGNLVDVGGAVKHFQHGAAA